MAKDKIVWHMNGFEELRRLPQVEAILLENAEKIADKTGMPDYLAVTGHGKSRSRAAVITSNAVAMQDNASNHTLEKAVAEVEAEKGK